MQKKRVLLVVAFFLLLTLYQNCGMTGFEALNSQQSFLENSDITNSDNDTSGNGNSNTNVGGGNPPTNPPPADEDLGGKTVFFSENFETGQVNSNANPVWSWNAVPTLSTMDTAGMYGGSADIYSVSSDRAFTGNYSWRLNFAGRNNWCNQCGSVDVEITQNELDAGCINTNGGAWANSIFNSSNGFSRWQVTSSNSNQVCFNKSAPNATSLFGSSSIKAGDILKLPYRCGINGTVGGDISRRSDCDKAINYLAGASASFLGYGKSISRRFYIYIPSQTTLPSTTLKLGYTHARVNGSRIAYTLKLSVQRNLTIELSAPGEGVSFSGSADNKYKISRDRWYYLEEVFKRESSANLSDGTYKLYMSPADNLSLEPIVEQTNVTIGELMDMSFNGNFQHNNDVSGYVYFDDIVVADGYVGPRK